MLISRVSWVKVVVRNAFSAISIMQLPSWSSLIEIQWIMRQLKSQIITAYLFSITDLIYSYRALSSAACDFGGLQTIAIVTLFDLVFLST